MTNSKRKGKNGELEACKELNKYLPEYRRSQQYKGETDAPDIISCNEKLNNTLRIEVKRCQQIKLDDWMDKLKKECKDGQHPIIMHRKNGKKWMATMPLEDWVEIIKQWFIECVGL